MASSRMTQIIAWAVFSVKRSLGTANRTASFVSPMCGERTRLSALSIVGSSSIWLRRSQMQFRISSRLESSVFRARASCLRDSSGFASNSLSAALSFIAAPVMFCTMESWSSVASRVRSLTLSSDALLANLAAARSRPFLSDIFWRSTFQTRTAVMSKTSAAITTASRAGVHHGGRARTTMSALERAARKRLLCFGNGAEGRQKSDSITQTPVAATKLPTSMSIIDSLASEQSIWTLKPSAAKRSRRSPVSSAT